MQARQTTLGALDAVIVDAGSPDGGGPEWLVVLCHGYGAPGTDLVPLAPELMQLRPELTGKARFVFPAAPLDLAAMGMPGARAWWPIEVGRFEAAMRTGDLKALEGLLSEEPDGLPSARRKLAGTVERALQQAGLGYDRLVLGGFSQGAMISTDLALSLDEPPALLGLFSGTFVAKERWTRLAPKRAGLRTFQTHGRWDPLLPFVVAESLRDMLAGAGLEVAFEAFDGMHTIARPSLSRFAEMLAETVG